MKEAKCERDGEGGGGGRDGERGDNPTERTKDGNGNAQRVIPFAPAKSGSNEFFVEPRFSRAPANEAKGLEDTEKFLPNL